MGKLKDSTCLSSTRFVVTQELRYVVHALYNIKPCEQYAVHMQAIPFYNNYVIGINLWSGLPCFMLNRQVISDGPCMQVVDSTIISHFLSSLPLSLLLFCLVCFLCGTVKVVVAIGI